MEELKTSPSAKNSPKTSPFLSGHANLQSGYRRAAEMLEVGMPPGDIATVLRREGLAENDILHILQGCATMEILTSREDERNRGSAKDMRNGIYWCAGGMMLTSVNILVSGPIGLYFPAWCAVLYGVLRLLKALRNTIR